MIIRKLLLLPFLLLTFSIHASLPADSTTPSKPKKDSTFVQYFTNNFEKYGILRYTPFDTSIIGVQNYDPLYRFNRFSASLGNMGQASQSLLPFPNTPSVSGFDYGIHSYDPYIFRNDSVRYYRIYKTFTELRYLQGANKELFFNVIFSRNIYRRLNLGFDFRALSANGTYLRQKTNDINFVITAQFFSKNRRYGAIANYRINYLREQDNGGIKYDSVFELNQEANREIIPIWLDLAMTRIKENGFYIKNYVNLSRHHEALKDSAVTTRKGIELGRISFSFEYNRQTQNYIDDNLKNGFYQNFYLDTLQTQDSITVHHYTSILSWTNPNFKPDKENRLLQIEGSIKHDYTEVYNDYTRKYFNLFIPFGNLSFTPYYGLQLNAYADYVIGDYNGGDMSIKASLTQLLGKQKKNAGYIVINAGYSLQKPGWFYQHYSGNNFRWDTAWKQQGFITGGFSYGFKEIFQAGVTLSRISNFVYLDSAVAPQQFVPEFGYMQIWTKGKAALGNLTVTGHLVYQTIQGTTVVRAPAFLGNINLYYSVPLFKGAAVLVPGLTFNYNSIYYANSYMPSVRSFYLQDKKETGDYLYMDVFLNLKIQRARIFAMYSHFNSSLMGNNYYMVPHYPQPDAAFKFGLTWRFHD